MLGVLSNALKRTRSALGGLFEGRRELDEELVEELETALLSADVGVEATRGLIDDMRGRVKGQRGVSAREALSAAMLDLLRPRAQTLQVGSPGQGKTAGPFVILVVGVNGTGKTTTIGKLGHRLLGQGYSVMLAAGDTFRAAAVEQLRVWGERNGVPVVAQEPGADSASVIFDAYASGKRRGVDVLIADTAGRLHTQKGLMDELAKVARVLKKLDSHAPHEVLLVLDAGIGQNALNQVREFSAAVGVSGLALTKLDGTAKGGVVLALAKESAVPVRFVGVGEGIKDLEVFDAENFVAALLDLEPL